jgi:hypothetical protein
MDALRLYALIVAGGISAAALTAYLLSKRKTDADRERERRQRINEIGRITGGIVTDIHEIPTKDGTPASQLLIYTYDVSGVAYDASQDVTHLRDVVDPKACRIGLPASVKYDPQNPANSIVIAEGWTGIRKK